MPFIDEDSFLVVGSLGKHRRCQDWMRYFWTTYEQAHSDLVARGWTFEVFDDAGLSSETELRANSVITTFPDGSTLNWWDDRDKGAGWLPSNSSGFDWFDIAWTAMQPFPGMIWNEDIWFEQLGRVFPPLLAGTRYAIGMQLRIEIRLCQIRAAHCLENLFCLHPPRGVA